MKCFQSREKLSLTGNIFVKSCLSTLSYIENELSYIENPYLVKTVETQSSESYKSTSACKSIVFIQHYEGRLLSPPTLWRADCWPHREEWRAWGPGQSPQFWGRPPPGGAADAGDGLWGRGEEPLCSHRYPCWSCQKSKQSLMLQKLESLICFYNKMVLYFYDDVSNWFVKIDWGVLYFEREFF